jgi:hypothetical protein
VAAGRLPHPMCDCTHISRVNGSLGAYRNYRVFCGVLSNRMIGSAYSTHPTGETMDYRDPNPRNISEYTAPCDFEQSL